MARENPLDTSMRHIFATGGQEFLPYERDGKSIPGMSWFPLSADAKLGRGGRYLLKLDPGTEGPLHQHGGYDEFFVLEGSIIDSDGIRDPDRTGRLRDVRTGDHPLHRYA
ncbi:MAG: hypothetical protein J4F40_00995 [Alphaproteobacteria bacterium]|nr:hypothetical protein [Alphaproteobacteria bacterium]